MSSIPCSTLALVLAVVAGSCLAAAPAKAGSITPASPVWAVKDLRAGMVGLDTSHATAFAGVFKKNPQWRIKLVAALPEDSKDMPQASVARCPKYTDTLRKQGVKIVASMDELLGQVDVVLIESVDGRPHLRQAAPALKAGKPVFVDKPFTASLADAREILRLAKETGTPFFSSSCVRFQPEVIPFRCAGGKTPAALKIGRLTKAQGSSPLHLEPHHPDLFYYGIHGVEALYTVMGPGCASVHRKVEGDLDITTGTWTNGKVGVFRGVKKGDYKPLVHVWGTEGQAQSKGGYNYNGLCETIAKFFQSGKPPIDPAETLEIVEFMVAAQLSKERGGAEVTLAEVRKLADQAEKKPAKKTKARP